MLELESAKTFLRSVSLNSPIPSSVNFIPGLDKWSSHAKTTLGNFDEPLHYEVVLPYSIDPTDTLFAIGMHEFGHVYSKHGAPPRWETIEEFKQLSENSVCRLWRTELEAWDWAHENAPYWNETFNYTFRFALGTYVFPHRNLLLVETTNKRNKDIIAKAKSMLLSGYPEK